ncbi:helix-turn-helix domain-containing protein [Dyadobacter crusticola]|uniref:helix-turn-helix domain-containing protein n=1 Tax=Dyadobacter crusticola TaxID=292407 RepID=UPI00068A9274|nr:helix-turn-helix domain-containing protein [Dyadobacter crusticola]
MQQTITFDLLPQAVGSLLREVQEIRRIIEAQNGPAPVAKEEILDIKGAAKFLNISEQTIYQKGDRLPRRKRFGKLYFLRSELEVYMAEGKIYSKK